MLTTNAVERDFLARRLSELEPAPGSKAEPTYRSKE